MLAVGTLVGAGIATIGLGLGLAVLVRPVAGSSRVVTHAIPAAIAGTLLFWFVARDNEVSRLDGGLLLAAFAAVVAYLVRETRQESAAVKESFAGVAENGKRWPWWVGALAAVLGLAALVVGAWLAVLPAAEIANKELVVGGRVFGLTAVGPVLAIPAVLVTVAAARSRRGDLALGTAAGATLCTVLMAAGVVALVAPFGVTDPALMNDVPALVLFALLLLVPLANGLRTSRWEGLVLVAASAGFVAWQTAGRGR
jgi:cation:H+ antiporter